MVVEIGAILLLGVVIIGQLIERYVFAREMMKQLQKAQAAIFARNVGDYLAATKDDPPHRDTVSEPEEVELADLSDADYDRALGI